MLYNSLRFAVFAIFCSVFCYSSSAVAQNGTRYVSGGRTSYARKSTDAQRKMMPRSGKSATLSSSNPYEKRKVDMLSREEDYQEALKRWEAKVAQKEAKDREKRMKSESRRQAALKSEKERRMKESARLSQQKKDNKFNLFGSSTAKSSQRPAPATPVVTDSTQTSYQQEAELELPRPSAVQQAAADSQPKPATEPGFFTKLKWALFGK